MEDRVKLHKRIEIYVHEMDDRLIYIERDINDKIIGLNFMQEHTYFEGFQKDHMKNCPELLEDYNLFIERFSYCILEEQELEVLNDFLWYRFRQQEITVLRNKK